MHNKDKSHCPRGHEYTPENTYVFGRYRYCKTCRKENKPIYVRRYLNSEKGRTATARLAAKHKLQNKEKVNAGHKVTRAVRSKKLLRPDHCPDCGAPGAFTRNGKSTIQAHHSDYSKPLDVSWKCVRCHRAEHRRLQQAGRGDSTQTPVRL